MSLKKLLKHLRAFWHKDKIISHVVAHNELILRAIFTPLFFSSSKKKLNSKTFLPPTRHSDVEQLSLVSVFRRDFSSDNSCKDAALKIKMNQQAYIGFLSFLPEHITTVNNIENMPISAEMIYSPIDEKNNYLRPVDGNIFYTSDSGLPMHAEIKYAKPIDIDNPNTGHRLFADTLLEMVKQSIHIDKFPNDKGWLQDDITFIQK